MTSYPDRTSPVVRGKWILENLLGTPPPPPLARRRRSARPTNGGGEVLSMRERLAQHRANPRVRGLPLDDGSARPRARELRRRRQVADARRVWLSRSTRRRCCPTAPSSTGPAGLQARRCSRDPIASSSTLTEKLLTYAVGRRLEYYDTPVDSRDPARGGAKRLSLHSALMLGIVQSAPFPDEENRRHDRAIRSALPRRTFLRGIGATLALPLLDAMVPAFSATAKTAAQPVRRLGFVYCPTACR